MNGYKIFTIVKFSIKKIQKVLKILKQSDILIWVLGYKTVPLKQPFYG